MEDDSKSLSDIIAERNTTSPAGHVLNVLKAGLATAPFCGGIASLMTDYIPNSKQSRIEDFAERVAVDLEALQDKVDESAIFTDNFAYTFEKCFRGAAENYQKEKLEAFRGILVNSAIGSDLPDDEKEYFINLVNTLSPLHMRLLKFTFSPVQYLNENSIPQESIRGGFSQFFPVAIPGVNVEVIKSAFGELYQYGFLSTDKSIFSTMTSGQGLDLLGNGSRVTELGKRFISFCTSPCH
ncbi:MAG: hypothetical protein ACI9W6_000280 [Motiliproteus sp.]|jgi:hypothetical protein